MMRLGKRGISDIIVSMIMIVIVLGAITIVWFLIRGFVGTGSEQINTGTQCLEVDIAPISLACAGSSNATCDVTVSRGAGGKEIGGIKLVFANSTGTKNYVHDSSGNINVLETKTVSGVNTTIANANKVDVVVYFKDDSGKEQLCTTKTTYSSR
jgi:hypothetical protein